MEKIDIDKISNSRNLRLYVLEHTLLIEELISETVGTILDIDWKNSKSFGFSSSALSFNQKLIIIQDLKGITQTDIKKFNHLMNIRNKFAHVRSIETSDEFYSKAGNGLEIKKDLEKWYTEKLDVKTRKGNDGIFRVYFKLLCKDIIGKLVEIILRVKVDNLKKNTEEQINLMQYIELKSALLKQKNGLKIIRRLEKKTGWKF